MAILKNTAITGTLGVTGVTSLEQTNIGDNTTGANLNTYATLGADLSPGFTAAAWTLGTGWDATNAGDTYLNKNADGTGTATPSGTGATPVSGTTYKITFTATVTVTAFSWSYGGNTGTAITTSGTYTYYVTATSTAKLIFNPNPTGSRFTITAISINAETVTTGDAIVEGDIRLGGAIKNNNGVNFITLLANGTTKVNTNLTIAGALAGATYIGSSNLNTITRSGLGFIPTPGLYFTNTTAGTAVAPVQHGPDIQMLSRSFDTSDTYSVWRIINEPYYDPTLATSRIRFASATDSTGNSDLRDKMSIGSEGTLDVLGSTYSAEVLTNPNLTSGTSWDRTGDMAYNSNNFTYTHSSGVGTLFTTAAFATAAKANRWYKLVYTTSTVTTGCTAYIKEGEFTAKRIYIGLVAGTYTVFIKSAASAPTVFKIYVTSTAGNFTIDTFSLMEVQSGNIIANGKFTGGGTSGLAIDSAGAATFDGAVSVSVAGNPLTITNTTDAASNQVLVLQGDRATPTANDNIYQTFMLSNSVGVQKEAARITARLNDITSTSEDGDLKFGWSVGGTLTDRVRMEGAILGPVVNDGITLGNTSYQWADLFLAEGGVINWDNGDATLTQTGNVLKLAGAALETDGVIELGHASDTTLTRVSAGVVSIEGSNIMTVGSADTVTGAKTMSSIILPTNGQINLTLPTTDTHCTGNVTSSFQSGYTAAAGDLVFMGSSSKWLEVDADAVATCNGLIGIALEAKNDTEAMKVALPGSMVRFDAWNWTVGATLYAGETLGAMQEAMPTGVDTIIKVVGFAVNADTVYFYPSPDQQSSLS